MQERSGGRALEPSPLILVVDDDTEIRELLSRSLSESGFRTAMAVDVQSMERQIERERPGLILLDIMLPGEDGLSACRRLIASDGPPVVFLSALGEEDDRVTGLELGASHYLTKPCSAREVVATVRAALRSSAPKSDKEVSRYGFDGWQLDALAHELLDPDGVLVHLTDGEFSTLEAFVQRPRRILSRDQLLEWTGGPDTEAFDRAVDVRISRLRRKLRSPGDDMIRTVRNEGYLFVPMVTRR